MFAERADLLARILAFDIDGGEVALPFVARLARENGWSRPYAERVVEEYKRFVFLAVTGTAPVCPSEDVDAAWHLHLTYSRSYWKRFCGEVLGRPLHHDPTRGGPDEGAKHLAMYADTLARYRAEFGASAPADVWPAGVERFGADTEHRAVNTARNWVIPKAPVKRVAFLVGAGALIALLVPGCDGGLNPYALKNDQFLMVMVFALISAVCVGRVMRSVLRKPDPLPEDDARELTWEETAFLAGGAGRLATATIARLVGRGLAEVDTDTKRLVAIGPTPDDVSGAERAVLRMMPVANDVTALKPVQDAVEATFAARSIRMQEEGLLLSETDKARIWLLSLIPLALVLLCLSAPRLVMGVIGNHPVGYLVGISLVGGLVGAGFTVAGTLRLSNRGQALLAKQKERHDALRAGTKWESGSDAGMAVALFGTAVLAGTTVAALQTWYPRQTGDASSGGCGGGGCGSGCGGGDGGGGGCGGGCGGGGD
jgi:uncharacterized protein (TIGR04222 family)